MSSIELFNRINKDDKYNKPKGYYEHEKEIVFIVEEKNAIGNPILSTTIFAINKNTGEIRMPDPLEEFDYIFNSKDKFKSL